jgi:hypothetical protein
MKTLVFICVGSAVILWIFIAVLFVGITIYNRISGRNLSFKKNDVKVQNNNVADNKDRSDLFL